MNWSARMLRFCGISHSSTTSKAAFSFRRVTKKTPAMLQRPNRSEEHTSELQSHRYLPSFPTRRSADLDVAVLRDLAFLDHLKGGVLLQAGDKENAGHAPAAEQGVVDIGTIHGHNRAGGTGRAPGRER